MPPSDIRIRAIPNQQPSHGEEGPFLSLSADDKAALGRIGEVVEFKTAGSEILASGEQAKFLYLLTAGVVEANRPLANGERHVIAFYWPGDLFGLAESGVYVNSARTLAKCTVYRFQTRELAEFLLQHPGIQRHFLVKAVHDLRNSQRQVIMMGRLNVLKRLAVFLLDCSAHDAYFDAKTRALALPMTRYDIADYLGTSAEVATRAFGRLEAESLLHRLTPRTLGAVDTSVTIRRWLRA
ncbi:MAG: Crp/Fnr family transcriptional regulator [Devosia sp.]|nr:Crp/Fnr family transcriptional regulator [Devosia sp.]